MNKILILGVLVALLLFFVAAFAYLIIKNPMSVGTTEENSSNSPVSATYTTDPIMKHLITINTNYGEIQFATYDEDAPKTAKNFIDLAQKGFYNNLIFHRVIKDFMIQGGDPNCKASGADSGTCGTGGPGYQFDDELDARTPSYSNGYLKGVVAMANSGPNTNGSQFFIMLKDNPTLPKNYTIFGKVTKGQDVVDKIGFVSVDANDRPVTAVVISKVTVEDIK